MTRATMCCGNAGKCGITYVPAVCSCCFLKSLIYRYLMGYFTFSNIPTLPFPRFLLCHVPKLVNGGKKNVQALANRKSATSAFVQKRCQSDRCPPGRQIDFDRNAGSAKCQKVVARRRHLQGGGGIFRNFLTKDFEAAILQRQTLVLV